MRLRTNAAKAVRLLLVLGFAASPATACAEGDPSPPAATGTRMPAQLPPQPFEILLGVEWDLVDRTQMTVRDECLAQAGYPQNQQLYDDLRTTAQYAPMFL